MTAADMERVRDEFARAARWAVEAGFDLVELHMAHGYLLGSFLSPLTNRRSDAYGGALENRLRFPLEVLDAVRAVLARRQAAVGAHLRQRLGRRAAPRTPTPSPSRARSRAHGCDIVDVSAGGTVPEARPVGGRLYQTPFAERVRHEAGVPTMTVGNISSWADINSDPRRRPRRPVPAGAHAPVRPVLHAPRRLRAGRPTHRRNAWPVAVRPRPHGHATPQQIMI